MLIDRRIFNHFNYKLLLATLFICAAGLVVLYSAGFDPNSTSRNLGIFGYAPKSVPFTKQAMFMGVGLIFMLVGMVVNSQSLYRVAYPFYIACILMLIGVLLFGTVVNGSRRWFPIGDFRFQPSEIAKVAVILVMARYLSRTRLPLGGFTLKSIIIPTLLMLLPMSLIIRQPDLGTALSLGSAGFGMLFFVGIRPRTLVSLAILGAIAVVPVWNSLHDYQKRRVWTLIDPTSDPLGSGYHLNQSKIAVGSGAFAGKGYFQGTQAQLEFLPEHTTDFVFSVLAEEWGFLGSVIVLGLYFFFMVSLLSIISKSRDIFASFIVVGVSSLFFFHIIVNIGMVIGILPVVGITLPLFSYGGSSVLVSMFCIGIVLGISMRKYQFGRT
ncbi:MAG: rod shape-determining protein RodA [bacterium]|nr:rod shape-determining protein RodA [bacterium]